MRTPARYDKILKKKQEISFANVITSHFVPIIVVCINSKWKVSEIKYITIRDWLNNRRGQSPVKLLKELQKRLRNDLNISQRKSSAIKNSRRLFRFPIKQNETLNDYMNRALQRAKELFEQ